MVSAVVSGTGRALLAEPGHPQGGRCPYCRERAELGGLLFQGLQGEHIDVILEDDVFLVGKYR